MQGEEEQVSKYGNKKSVSLNGKPQKGHKLWLHSSDLFKTLKNLG